jgi:fibronectin type 3 domain-containing protein
VYDTVTSAGTQYYAVSTYYNGQESVLSTVSNGVSRSLPAIPPGLTVSKGTLTDSIEISWTSVTGADGYRLYRDTDPAFGSIALIGSPTATSVRDGISDDLLYYYKVKSYNSAGESVLSVADSGFRKPTIVPDAPGTVSASDTSALHIRVWWRAPSAGANVNGYTVYRATTETGSYTLLDSTEAIYLEDAVPSTYPTYYWYKVKAYNAVGEGSFSNAASGTRQ